MATKEIEETQDPFELIDDDELIFAENHKKNEGYMKVFHYVTENIIKQRLSGCEYAVVLLLLRMTWGYKEKYETALPLSFIREKTGYNINRINQAILKLMKRRIVVRTRKATLGRAAHHAFNSDVDEWDHIK